MSISKCSTLIIEWLSLKLFFYYVLFTFGFRVRLKLGVFSDSNILKNCPQANSKVRVRLGCGLNCGFYGTFNL